MSDRTPEPSGTPPGAPSGATPEARLQPRRHRYSWIWLIPVVTLLVGVYLAVSTILSEGPTVKVTFLTAEGLKAGQSPVRFKDVELGTVRGIQLSDDLTHVEVTLDMRRSAARLLTSDAKFWVVKPRFFAGNLQGLETLLSGGYVNFRPGTPDGERQDKFAGLDEPPVLQTTQDGTAFSVRAARIGSISAGSPVFYRDLDAGEVLGFDLGGAADYVTLHVFVRSPFDKFVFPNSRFWNASGLKVSLGGNGIEVKLASLRALLLGGVAFDTPGGRGEGAVQGDTVFPLFKDEDDARSASYGRQLLLRSVFDGSVRGLSVGSEIDLRGIKIGSVTRIDLRYDNARDAVEVAVDYDVQPERITNNTVTHGSDPVAAMRDLVARGMRARLVSGNILTGAQNIALDIVEGSKPAEMGHEDDRSVIPTAEGAGTDNIASSAADLLNRINQIPFAEIGRNLNDSLAGVAALTRGPELKGAVADLHASLAQARDFLGTLNREGTPALRRLPGIADGLQDSVARLNKLVSGADSGYGGKSQFKRDLDRLLQQLDDTATSIRVLADLLTRHPEALVRGRTGGAE